MVPRTDFAIVDVPANFEIQARKVMPLETGDFSEDNLNTWWGRANLMVITESEYFKGKVHLRMYPGEFKDNTYIQKEKGVDGSVASVRDVFELYEAWAWHRGDYFNVKIGRWDNTTRYGSMTFGGYLDAKKNLDISNRYDRSVKSYAPSNKNRRESGFMSTYTPENALLFGFSDYSENISLDISLISDDSNLNRGDLRAYFSVKDIAGVESMSVGIGYRSNIFDEVYSKYGDVTHNVSLGFRMPIARDIGLLKSLVLFGETALIGIDDQQGVCEPDKCTLSGNAVTPVDDKNRADKGGKPNDNNPTFPILGGLEIALYQGFDKIVIEAEYDGDRKNKTPGDEYAGTKTNARDVQGSIFLKKALNDRFTLNLGMQSEHNTKDFSFAGRLQGRIN
jgi:hypothetical protein